MDSDAQSSRYAPSQRKAGCPCCKQSRQHSEDLCMDVYEFYNLGIGEPMPVSQQQTVMGLGDMLDEVIKHFPEGRRYRGRR